MAQTPKVSRSLLTPLKFLQRSAALYPDKTAVVYGEQRYSYGRFGERVHRLTSALLNAGLKRHDRVAFLCPNTPPMLEAHFAVPWAGGVLVAVNTRLAPAEIAYILNHSGAKFLFVDAEFLPLIEPVRKELEHLRTVVPINDLQAAEAIWGGDYESFLQAGSPTPTPWQVDDEEETLAINYTSGTTGRPKGVMYTHRGASLNALGEILEMGLNSESVYLWTLPMFHCNGWCFTWATAAAGATNVCLRKVEPQTAWDLIQREGVTHYCGAPVVHSSLVHHPNRPSKLAKPITAGVAGAPPSPTLLEKVEELGVRVIHVYGLTETYGPHTVGVDQPQWRERSSEERARLRARQGVGYLIADPVRVVDENMSDVPADGVTMGEVVMQGNNVMKGYFHDPEATAQAFRGGWFHSGDLAVMHPDGYIELRDRGKDVIITGGENVSSIEVEQILYRHPAVLEVAVVGVPHDKWGETPKAFVGLKPGATAAEQELIDFCRERLSRFKCPTAIEFRALPKTSTGKIQKFVLRNEAWAGRDKKIQGA